MIVWDDATMKTGVSIVDEQHKMLFQKFNELSDAISGVTAGETAGELLDFLQFYATWHFGQEENCMNEHKCPVAAENKHSGPSVISPVRRSAFDRQIFACGQLCPAGKSNV